MQLISMRAIPFIEFGSLTMSKRKEALFRDGERGFFLYLSKDVSSSSADERIISLEAREALIWLNQHPGDQEWTYIGGSDE
jgi:hypothetical protein